MNKKGIKTQGDIIRFIDSYFSINHARPSIMRISQALQLSMPTVKKHMLDMSDKGIISYSSDSDYSTPRIQRLYSGLVNVALVGSIRCGLPLFAEQNITEYFLLPQKLVGNKECFLLRASGDSMINAGIDDGDLVLIKMQNTAENGDIVVAIVEDSDATLKRYYCYKDYVRLKPENYLMDDILVKECIIQGVVAKVFKDFEHKSTVQSSKTFRALA